MHVCPTCNSDHRRLQYAKRPIAEKSLFVRQPIVVYKSIIYCRFIATIIKFVLNDRRGLSLARIISCHRANCIAKLVSFILCRVTHSDNHDKANVLPCVSWPHEAARWKSVKICSILSQHFWDFWIHKKRKEMKKAIIYLR